MTARLRALLGCTLVAVACALAGGLGAGAMAASGAPVTGEPTLDALAPWLGGPSVGAGVAYALVKLYGLLHRWTALAERFGDTWVKGDLAVPLDVRHSGEVAVVDDARQVAAGRPS